MTTLTIERPVKGVEAQPIPPRTIGLAFQGGCFFAGALGTGVVRALIETDHFYRMHAFSGTSAGALVAAMCWKHKLANKVDDLTENLKKQWLENAVGAVFSEDFANLLKLLDRLWSLNPFYYHLWKEKAVVPTLHQDFERWVEQYVEPKECMQLLYDGYIASFAEKSDGWIDQARANFRPEAGNDGTVKGPPRLVISATEIHQGEVVTIDDKDLFKALLDAFGKARALGMTIDAARTSAIDVAAKYMTMALMASGSLDEVNGLTEIRQIPGMSIKERHKGHYLDGAWAENPAIKELIDCDVDEIWMVEVFSKLCMTDPSSYEAREDRKEELWQNALVEQQLYFIHKVNLWLKSGRLIDSEPALTELRDDLIGRLTAGKGDPELLRAFNAAVSHHEDYDSAEKIARHITQSYRPVTTRCIELPASLQPLTAGARIVNTPSYLIDKMEIGYENAKRFVRTLPYGGVSSCATHDS